MLIDASSSVVHPYGIEFDQAGTLKVFPAAQVLLETVSGERASFICLIDSGATISVLPRSDAAVLGIEYMRGEKIKILGISSRPIHGWRHTIATNLTGHILKIPWVFIDSDTAPRILGREMIFYDYTVIFEQEKNRTALLGKDTRSARKVSQMLDGILAQAA